MRTLLEHRPRGITCVCLLLFASFVSTITPLPWPFNRNQEDVHGVVPYDTFGLERDAFSRAERITDDPDELKKYHAPVHKRLEETYKLLIIIFHPDNITLAPRKREELLKKLPKAVAERVRRIFKNAPYEFPNKMDYFRKYINTIFLHKAILSRDAWRHRLDLALLPWKEYMDAVEGTPAGKIPMKRRMVSRLPSKADSESTEQTTPTNEAQ